MAKKQNKGTSRSSTSIGQAQRLGIFGASGSGKTTKARELTGKLGRIVYFDPLQELARERGIKAFRDLESLKSALRKEFARGFRFAFCPGFGDEISQLNDLCYFLVALQNGYMTGQHTAKMTLVVDELDLGFPSGMTQRDPKNGFAYLCRRGRHYGINLVGISQRPAQVDVCFRANCSGMYLFRHTDPIDFDIGVKMLGREYRETFRKLDNYQYIYKSGQKIFVKK